MRVLHLASGREWRGGQRQTVLLTRGLSRHTEISQSIVTDAGGELARRIASPVRLRGVRWSMGLDPRALPAAWIEARHADVVHAHDAHAVAIGAVVSRLAGKPLVATRRMARPLRQPWVWRRAARVIAISDAVRRQLEADGIPPERIVVIPPALDLEATANTPAADWAGLGIGAGGTPVAIAVAALTPEKGLDLVIEAAARLAGQLPTLRWVVAGEGPERPSLEMLIRARSLTGFVHLIGHVQDPLPLIRAATVLVMPSREEGFGSTILDALALGTPVVAAAVGGVPEALSGGGGMMIPAEDPGALADAVARIVIDPGISTQLATEGRLAVTHCGLGPMVEMVTRVYRSCIGI